MCARPGVGDALGGAVRRAARIRGHANRSRAAGRLALSTVASVFHRDIKPHNIFLVEEWAPSPEVGTGGISPGSVKVGDFGIARTAAETAVTETSLILGTVRYVSPEQAAGEEVGPPSDLYSLG